MRGSYQLSYNTQKVNKFVLNFLVVLLLLLKYSTNLRKKHGHYYG